MQPYIYRPPTLLARANVGTWLRKAILYALLLPILSGGSREAEEAAPLGMVANGGLVHPQAQFLPFADQPRANARLNDSIGDGDLLMSLLESLQVLHTVGADSSAPFGEVAKVVAIGEDVGVFDPYQAGLHVVAPDGTLETTVGRAGAGPGEFRRPTAVYVPHPDTLLLADVMRKIEVFARSATSSEWRHVRTVTLDFSVSDICRGRDAYFAYGYATPGSGGPIRELDDSLRVSRQFGEVYASQNEGINHAFATYAMACDAATDRIVVAPKAGIGELYFVDGAGAVDHILHWVDYKAFHIEEDSTGYSVRPSQDGVNRLRTLGMLAPGILLVQYDWVSASDLANKSDYSVLHSLAIDMREATILARSISLPPLSVLDAGRIAMHLTDPSPGVAIGAIRNAGRGR